MNWKELLKSEIKSTYKVTEGLLDLVDDDSLGWLPSTENNWMTVSKLLMHITNSCGAPMRGFVTGDWGIPEGVDLSDLFPEEMLPTAEKMPAIESIGEAKKFLAEDRQLALDMLEKCSEERLAGEAVPAPWDPTERTLGHRLLQMVEHLKCHKCQLFYYLKLQGKSVNTSNLWGA